MIRYGNFVIADIRNMYLLIPLAILLFILIKKHYVKDKDRLIKVKGRKRFLFFSKLLIFACLLMALSSPYFEYTDKKGNITKIKVLIDKSDSMEVFNMYEVEETLSQLNLPVEIHELDMNDYSALGNAILGHLKPEEHILLITDGQNNYGASLQDVALFAATINSRLYALDLKRNKDEASVEILGPSKVVSEVENTFTVKINKMGKFNVDTNIYIDGKFVQQTDKQEVEIKRSFSSGTHTIKASIQEADHFPENNAFQKVINVYDRPKILFVTKRSSPLFELYEEFYNIEQTNIIPEDLDEYHAIVLNDINDKYITEDNIDDLEDYLNDENGMFVVGGKDSYDWGEYNQSLLTNMLPVSIGKAKKKQDVTNIVIMMDTGASSIYTISGDITYFDVVKSLTVDLLEGIANTNRVAVLEANYYVNTISGLSELGPKRKEIIEEISYLGPHGATELRYVYEQAWQALRLNRGGKNIVILTDGLLSPFDQGKTLDLVKKAYQDNVKTYIVGVGDQGDEEFMMDVKNAGHGEYFKADETDRLNLYFGGDSVETDDDLEIFVYDSNHFITENLHDLGYIYGFNSVYPKTNARMLLSTNEGDPVLTIWNYGLGRVASLSTDDGSKWVPDLMAESNSKVLIKTLNWLVENPERKSNMVIDIPDLRIGENSVITIKADELPSENFFETDKGIYKSNIYPEEIGIIDILDRKAAVNYKKEYLNLGINQNLDKTLRITDGQLLENDPKIIEQKIQSLSDVETLRTRDLSWIFIFIAIIIYLFEILVRRIQDINLTKRY